MPPMGVGAWIDFIEPDEGIFERVLASGPGARTAYDEGTELPSRAAATRSTLGYRGARRRVSAVRRQVVCGRKAGLE